ncbi:MAG: hypothetical protein V4622_01835 [Bacteroidota bacterium]
MNKVLFIILLVFSSLNSCVSDRHFKKVEPYYLFHDNSSKVWLINHVYKNGKDEVPLSMKFKKIFVFHKTRNCYMYQTSDLNENQGKKGNFSLDIANKKLEINFKNVDWNFEIESLSEEKILLKSIKGEKDSSFYKMELISFPEF